MTDTLDRTSAAWLARRALGGARPGDLDELTGAAVPEALDRVVHPDRHGIEVPTDPWDDEWLTSLDEPSPRDVLPVIVAWLDHLATSPRPLTTRMGWRWHDHFVSSLAVVRHPLLLVNQIRLLERRGLGDFRTLLREITVDAAMLVYLDGTRNRAGSPNENHGRELLELFTVGVDDHTEDDVVAAASALTGWVVDRRTGAVRLVPRRHDGNPRRLLGRDGVHDVDTVVEAICDHPACARHVTATVARWFLGPVADDAVEGLTTTFLGSGLDLSELVTAVLATGLDGTAAPLISGPVDWLLASVRATGAAFERPEPVVRLLHDAGQTPMAPPNVGGWPGGHAWLAASTVVARSNLASLIVSATPTDSAALVAAGSRDLEGLADVLGRPEGFSASTSDALLSASPRDDPDGRVLLATALVAPELVVL